ncbi:hypothetical protein Tco_1105846 [Tanacetum coccineum]
MAKDQSIPRRNSVNWHYARDDYMFTTIKVVSRHEDTQLYGAILPNELTNEDIRNSESFKEYYVIASGVEPPKTKASVKKKQIRSDKTTTSSTTKGKRIKTSTKTAKPAKKKQPAKTSMDKGLTRKVSRCEEDNDHEVNVSEDDDTDNDDDVDKDINDDDADNQDGDDQEHNDQDYEANDDAQDKDDQDDENQDDDFLYFYKNRRNIHKFKHKLSNGEVSLGYERYTMSDFTIGLALRGQHNHHCSGGSWREQLAPAGPTITYTYYCPGVLGGDTGNGGTYSFIIARVFLEGTPTMGTLLLCLE